MSSLTTKFERFYAKYKGDIYRHIFFRVYNEELAHEMTNESFMKFYRYVAGGKYVKQPRAFVYRIANNMVIDWSRKKKETSLEQALEDNPHLEPSYTENPAKRVERRELIALIKQLPKDYQQIIYLRYFKDYLPKEIAPMLGTNANNISVRLNHAVKVLQRLREQRSP